MFRKYILPILMIFCGFIQSQDVTTKESTLIDSAYLSTKTNYFLVSNDSIYGEGSKVLNRLVKESQFIVLGERHNSRETSNFVSALIPVMKKHDYRSMCLEVGPQSAEKLEELMKPSQNTVKNLREFNSKYYSQIDDFPIPFFSGLEDAKFLAKASEFGFDIIGLDQEYYYAALFLMDQLLIEAKNEPHYNAIQILKENADKAIMEWFIKDNESEEEFDIFKALLENENVKQYFKAVDSTSEKATLIINDIKISWDIYSRYRNDSHADRISYMRNNFMAYYRSYVQEKGKAPKAFLKFGGLHTPQIISGDCYDIGYMVNEIATKQNMKCANINTWVRYYIKDGKEVDYADDWYKRTNLFIQMAKRDKWTIIDLESIREDILNGKIKLPTNGDYHELNELIQGFDYQLILPTDQRVTLNVEDGE